MDQEEPSPLSNLVTKKQWLLQGAMKLQGDLLSHGTHLSMVITEGNSEDKKDVAFAKIQRNLRNHISFRELTL